MEPSLSACDVHLAAADVELFLGAHAGGLQRLRVDAADQLALGEVRGADDDLRTLRPACVAPARTAGCHRRRRRRRARGRTVTARAERMLRFFMVFLLMGWSAPDGT